MFLTYPHNICVSRKLQLFGLFVTCMQLTDGSQWNCSCSVCSWHVHSLHRYLENYSCSVCLWHVCSSQLGPSKWQLVWLSVTVHKWVPRKWQPFCLFVTCMRLTNRPQQNCSCSVCSSHISTNESQQNYCCFVCSWLISSWQMCPNKIIAVQFVRDMYAVHKCVLTKWQPSWLLVTGTQFTNESKQNYGSSVCSWHVCSWQTGPNKTAAVLFVRDVYPVDKLLPWKLKLFCLFVVYTQTEGSFRVFYISIYQIKVWILVCLKPRLIVK
jgi:hypothetical protein